MKFKHFTLLLPFFLVFNATALSATAWYVNGVTGSDSNSCLSATTACKTIGHAIWLVSSGDAIMVAPATYTENLTVSISLKIIGSGATTTIIDGGAVGTVVTISDASANVTLSKLTIQNGYGSSGLDAGGVINNGTLTINNSNVSGNHSSGGIHNGGTLRINNSNISGNTRGILNDGTLKITDSTISGNTAVGVGGGIANEGTLTINNSTLSGNVAFPYCDQKLCLGGIGGAVWNTAALTINNGTISGNSAERGGGGIYGRAMLQNSIVANNSVGGNCRGTMVSNGYNLSSDDTCGFNGPGDMNNTDPMLGPLQNNGGPTQTMALPSGSPAIDAGNPAGCTDELGHLLKTDQRGKLRPDTEDTSGCDTGAYERQGD